MTRGHNNRLDRRPAMKIAGPRVTATSASHLIDICERETSRNSDKPRHYCRNLRCRTKLSGHSFAELKRS